jgi:hypothetical protein
MMSHEQVPSSSSTYTRTAEGAADRPAASVRFRDPTGREWEAREIDATVPGHTQEHCLIISSHEAVRRVWRYPADWRERPLVDLVALLDAR